MAASRLVPELTPPRLSPPRLGALSWIALVPLLMALGCDDPPPPPPRAATTAPPTAPKPPPPPKKKEEPKVEAEPELTDGDFVAGVNNRDPFRSFLSEFKPKVMRRGPVQRRVLLPRYGLDELRLIAVVSGRTVRARAMFRDPRGMGVAVKRGDRISKNEARVKRILRDSVILEVRQRAEDRSKAADRVIELHPKEEREKALREFEGRELGGSSFRRRAEEEDR